MSGSVSPASTAFFSAAGEQAPCVHELDDALVAEDVTEGGGHPLARDEAGGREGHPPPRAGPMPGAQAQRVKQQRQAMAVLMERSAEPWAPSSWSRAQCRMQ